MKNLSDPLKKEIVWRAKVGRPRILSLEYIIDRLFYVLITGMSWNELEVVNGSPDTSILINLSDIDYLRKHTSLCLENI